MITEQENVDEIEERLVPGRHNVMNSVNEDKQLTKNWCRLDVSNIIPGRKRSPSLI